MCLEVMLEQAGLEDMIVGCEAWPGAQYGEAVLRLSTWEAANQCIKHFHGCCWDSTGAPVTAELDQPAPGPPAAKADIDGGSIAYTTEQAVPAAKAEVATKGGYRIQSIADGTNKSLVDDRKPSPLSSPALTVASTATPMSPWRSPLFSPMCTPASRKVSWADLMSDDEDDDDENETSPGTNEDTESGSNGGAGTSDDGF
jgi:hypothetical protein